MFFFEKKLHLFLSNFMKTILFNIKSYQYLAEELLIDNFLEEGKIVHEQFPDGESYHRILSDLEAKSVVLLGGMVSDIDTLELYDLATAIVQGGAQKLHIIIPYFG